jgi:hypothetical protein
MVYSDEGVEGSVGSWYRRVYRDEGVGNVGVGRDERVVSNVGLLAGFTGEEGVVGNVEDGFMEMMELKAMWEMGIGFTGMRELKAMWGFGRVYRDEGVVDNVGGG